MLLDGKDGSIAGRLTDDHVLRFHSNRGVSDMRGREANWNKEILGFVGFRNHGSKRDLVRLDRH